MRHAALPAWGAEYDGSSPVMPAERLDVLRRSLLWASEKEWVEGAVARNRLTQRVVQRFVAGNHLEDAVQSIKDLNSIGVGGILDLLGEGVEDPAGVTAAAREYLDSIRRIEETEIDTTVAVKPTQLGLAIDKGACIDHLRRLAAEAEAIGTYVEIDIEQSEYVTDTIDVYKLLQPDFPSLRLAIQAYLRRTPVDLEGMASLKPRIRLVKGAYSESDEIALQKKSEIREQYKFLTDWLFKNGTDPAIATHDGQLLDHAKKAAARAGAGPKGFEIQLLYGIRRDLQEALVRQGFRVRIYVPFGSAWYPYLMRRLAERPANVRFFLRALTGK
jgi:proline dehydrogenase